ncbi:histidine kinase [Thioclava sp. IC9]|uniref:sensor histidine kinase n=1 Tax=Thioclava sp. IC9 TaxID=1973007 RepID=UPI0014124A70|nr:histidine kinase [Thioclava sp. IC9]
MPTVDRASSGFLTAFRWPLIAFSAILGLTPHILLLNHTTEQRLTMIIIMHAVIVPTLTAIVLRLLERRAMTLEAANAELRRTALDLERKNRQHEALSGAVRLLAAAPSVADVLKPLAELSREALRADRLRLIWTPPGVRPEVVVVGRASGRDMAADGSERVFTLHEGDTDLGRIAVSTEDWDSFDETSLSILSAELRLRWRLRQVEANALSALDPGHERFSDIGPRQTHRLLRVMCDAAEADGASLYLRHADTWQLQATEGRTHPVSDEVFTRPIGVWSFEDGATVCVKGTQDGALLLQSADGRKIDTATLDPPLVQMISGHSATLTRIVEGYQQALWGERQRIARELHDEVCQSIASVHMQLGHLETLISEGRPTAVDRCHQLREAALDAYEATRLAVDGFRRKPENAEVATDFLEGIARATSETRGIELAFHAGPIDLEPETAWQLGRILQEAIANAVRHGRARTVTVSLDKADDELVLTVLDDGTFRDPASGSTSSGGHHGLKIMAERVEELHGWFSVSHDDAGTEVQVKLPSI